MKRNIYTISMAFFLALSIKGNAQQDPGYTQYMYNQLVINPAYAGSTGSLEAILLHRSQWVGIDGAPETQSLTVHSPLRNDKLGLGFSVVNDKLGPSSEVYINGSFSYTINLNHDTKLAFGLNAGARIMNIDWSKGRFYDENDALLNQNIDNKFMPQIGAGMFLYKENWYVGLSVPSFIKSDYYDDIAEEVDPDRLHYNLSAGYVFDLSDNLKFKPAALIRVVTGAPVTYNLSGNFMFLEKFVLGAAYRFNDSVSGLAGFQISRDFFIGYAYDHTVTDLNKYNNGTHEIFIRFQMNQKSSQIKSPRFF
ncbi:PorP/SprF family type IX secretion system membrane protein [Flavobacterium silvaticum]|uniref:Type IX secretion system membrane protein PorP/SprF n=1 Tax=Flavobacterium silvaticum TaxID=1852020 RepID=A0A972JGZ1_9FLAO|nr:type IX secretion system membrane protein PorP/SprF [Flavobacterium silvaticum]NMH27390.1 type IX secretion system membrane protein PorP/SprF [Flavobacterium silvaticum]